MINNLNLKQLWKRLARDVEIAAEKAEAGQRPASIDGHPLAVECGAEGLLSQAPAAGRRYGQEQRRAMIRGARDRIIDFEIAWGIETPEAVVVAARRAENARLSAIRLKEAGEEYEAVLRHRCEIQKVTREKIQAAFDGAGAENPCSLGSQLRKWFAGMPIDKAMTFAVAVK